MTLNKTSKNMLEKNLPPKPIPQKIKMNDKKKMIRPISQPPTSAQFKNNKLTMRGVEGIYFIISRLNRTDCLIF